MSSYYTLNAILLNEIPIYMTKLILLGKPTRKEVSSVNCTLLLII